MRKKAHGQIRRSQVITTYGPGALIDLPNDSAIVAGLDSWPKTSDLQEIHEPRLTGKLQKTTDVIAPRFYAPPPDTDDPRESPRGIGAYRFPEWFVVQETTITEQRERSRRLISRKALDNRGRFDGLAVVATRFVRACPRGHVDDLDWYGFVHKDSDPCRRQLWLDERGTSGDLSDLVVRCECGKSRSLIEATHRPDTSAEDGLPEEEPQDTQCGDKPPDTRHGEGPQDTRRGDRPPDARHAERPSDARHAERPLGTCSGQRPWLGRYAREDCSLPSRLLIRTASNAYFPQVMSALSLPDRGDDVQKAVGELWDDLGIVESIAELGTLKKKPKVAEALSSFSDDEVLAAIEARKRGSSDDRPVKHVELDALLAAQEGFGDDVPVDPDFHARRLPEPTWRRTGRFAGIESVVQLHRLREVMVLAGFTRFEAEIPDANGEYETDVKRAQIAREPSWFPAVENRGEGVFLQIRAESVRDWLERPGVQARIDALCHGHDQWNRDRRTQRPFPGGPYVFLHTLSHLLLQSLAMQCGYPASSLRERVYDDHYAGRYGILLFTGSPDSDGTLGGLVQQARHLESHLAQALRMGSLCSNDPICANHLPGESMEERRLHGAACHGCSLVAETSCEMRNDYLDRALVVPVLGMPDAAFFPPPDYT